MSSAAKFISDGIWSWLQSPSPFYSSTDAAIYFPVVTANGTIRAYKLFTSNPCLQGFTLHSALEVDDHDLGAMVQLASGSIVSVYGKHAAAGQYRRIGTSVSDIRAWGSEASSSAESLTFANLWQSADTGTTVWNFDQRSSFPNTLGYQTSTDGGSTWSALTDFWSPSAGGYQPHARYCANGANRLDIFVSSGHPMFTAVSLYHMYMLVDSSGNPTWYNSNGVSLGSAPFSASTANMTRVYDGSATNSMPWDLKIIGGQPVVAFVVFPNAAGAATTTTTAAQIQYYQGAFNGTSWSTGLIAEAGATWNSSARQDWLYAAQNAYAPGICLDPNNANIVYLSKTYNGSSGVGATDCRLEQWTNSSGWSKTADVSGATSSLNCRPFAVQGLSPTQILYWNAATYSSYTSWSGSDIWAYPAITLPTTKTASPTWTSIRGPVGTQAYWLLAEGSGTQTKELVSGYQCPFIGAPTWGSNALGATLGGFSASIAVNCDGASSALAAAANSSAGYPRYIWAMFSNTNTSLNQYIIWFGNATSTIDRWALGVNTTAIGQIYATLENHAGSTAAEINFTSAAATDGAVHVVCYASTSANNHTLYLDGVSVGTSSASVDTFTFQNLTIGAIRRNGTQSNPFLGAITACGWGLGSPDQAALYTDLIGGQFGGTYGASTMSIGSPAAIPANHSGNITLTLAGIGTSWSGATTFTVSGVTGVSKASQDVSSTTAATVVVTTGSSAGTLTVSDGTNSSTITVGNASVSISPTSAAVNAGPQSITATGTNTVWTQETASTLFGVSGGTGPSVSSVSVATDTSATFTLGLGSASGTLTITDAPQGDTTTFTVNAAAATAYTLTQASPRSGYVGAASANFAVQANGQPGTSMTVTPHTSLTGTFTGSTVTVNDVNAHTFAFTPSASGTHTISVTHTGGSGISGDPPSVSYQALPQTISCSPLTQPPSTTKRVDYYGGGTTWLSGAPTISASGAPTGDGSWSLGALTVDSDTQAHRNVTTGTTTGTVTWTDSTTSATCTQNVALKKPKLCWGSEVRR